MNTTICFQAVQSIIGNNMLVIKYINSVILLTHYNRNNFLKYYIKVFDATLSTLSLSDLAFVKVLLFSNTRVFINFRFYDWIQILFISDFSTCWNYKFYIILFAILLNIVITHSGISLINLIKLSDIYLLILVINFL